MKQPSAHLSDAEIEQYGNTVSPAEAEGVDRAGEIEAHVADCDACRGRVVAFQRGLLQLTDSTVSTARYADLPGAGPDCPGEDVLRDLAAGLTPSDQGASLVQHAAQCHRCGPLLRMYTEDFSDELSAEDQAVLSQLESSSFAWQENLTRQMLAGAADSPAVGDSGSDAAQAVAAEKDFDKPRERKPFPWRWVLAPTALAACAAIVLAIWYSQRETPEKVEKLLAQAYTEDRQLEMRIPYAKHAEFHQTRSGESESLLNKPASLRKAADEIQAQLKKNPDDPKWLLLSAQLDLLDWHYKSAQSRLNKIDEGRVTDSEQFRLIQALVLYEKAEIEHDPQSYGEVVDLLGKTLQKSPDNPIALFNQALACEKLYMFDCAVKDYERFLNLSPDSDWSPEARNHLNRIKEKKTPGN